MPAHSIACLLQLRKLPKIDGGPNNGKLTNILTREPFLIDGKYVRPAYAARDILDDLIKEGKKNTKEKIEQGEKREKYSVVDNGSADRKYEDYQYEFVAADLKRALDVTALELQPYDVYSTQISITTNDGLDIKFRIKDKINGIHYELAGKNRAEYLGKIKRQFEGAKRASVLSATESNNVNTPEPTANEAMIATLKKELQQEYVSVNSSGSKTEITVGKGGAAVKFFINDNLSEACEAFNSRPSYRAVCIRDIKDKLKRAQAQLVKKLADTVGRDLRVRRSGGFFNGQNSAPDGQDSIMEQLATFVESFGKDSPIIQKMAVALRANGGAKKRLRSAMQLAEGAYHKFIQPFSSRPEERNEFYKKFAEQVNKWLTDSLGSTMDLNGLLVGLKQSCILPPQQIVRYRL